MTQINKIKVFGKQAENIQQGQIFEAQIGSVEGRKVVTLVPKLSCIISSELS